MSRIIRGLIPFIALLLLSLTVVGIAFMQQRPAAPLPAKDWQTLSDENQAAGYLQSALYAVTRAASETGWNEDLHHQAGDLWYEIGDFSRALPHYEIASLHTTDVFLLRRLGELYLQANRPQDALTTAERLLTLDPQNAWAHYQAGLLLAPADPRLAREHLNLVAFDESYAEVARTLFGVLLEDTTTPAQSFQVGAVLAQANLWSYAEWAFFYAATIGDPFAEAMAYAGMMQDLQGKDGSAAIDQAITLNPNSADVWLVQGVHLRRRPDYTASQVALMNALILDPQNPAIHAELGATYRDAGAIDEAVYWMQSAVQASGNDPLMSQALMQFYTDEADAIPDQALTALSAQAVASPQNPDTLSAYGWALHVTGDSALGLAKIEEALALDPTSLRVIFDKARVLLDTGNPDAARPLLEQVATSDSVYASPAKLILAGLQ